MSKKHIGSSLDPTRDFTLSTRQRTAKLIGRTIQSELV